jgi:hypothetical protein
MKIIINSLLVYLLIVLPNCSGGDNLDYSQKTNLSDFRSGSCCIFLKIKCNNKSFKIIIANSIMYGLMHSQYFWSEDKYISKLQTIISSDKYLEVNNVLYEQLQIYVIQDNFVLKYKNVDILSDTMLIKDNIINPKLNRLDRNAISYQLMTRKIRNCCVDDESGSMYLTPLK